MKVLFKKDFTISTKMIFLSLIGFSFLFGMLAFMVESYIVAQSLYASIVLLSTIGILNTIITEDDKYNTDMLFNSLPIERKTIVISKYLSMAVFPFIYGLSTFIISRAFELSDSMMFYLTPKNLFHFEGMVFSIALSFIFLSFYLPLYYLSIEKARMIGGASLVIVFILPIAIMKFTDNLGDLSIVNQYMKNLSLNISLLAVSITLYLISLQFSIKIYNKKE